MFKCDKCDKEFNYKSDLKKHFKLKKPCDDIPISKQIYKCVNCTKIFSTNGNLKTHVSSYCDGTKIRVIQNLPRSSKTGVTNDKIMCNRCNKIFTLKHSLKRHLDSRCKVKKQQDIDNDKQEIINNLIQKVSTMEETVNELKGAKQKPTKNNIKNSVNNSHNTTNNDNSTTNITNNVNIKLVANSKEDLSYMSDYDFFKIICRGFKSIPEFIKKINFDKDKPEHHNMYLPNIGSSNLMVHDGEDWMLVSMKDKFDDIIALKTSSLSSTHDDLIPKYREKNREKTYGFDRFIHELKGHDSEKLKSTIRSELKLMCFNSREMVLDTKNKVKNQIEDVESNADSENDFITDSENVDENVSESDKKYAELERKYNDLLNSVDINT
jgi:hypothetical protein